MDSFTLSNIENVRSELYRETFVLFFFFFFSLGKITRSTHRARGDERYFNSSWPRLVTGTAWRRPSSTDRCRGRIGHGRREEKMKKKKNVFVTRENVSCRMTDRPNRSRKPVRPLRSGTPSVRYTRNTTHGTDKRKNETGTR